MTKRHDEFEKLYAMLEGRTLTRDVAERIYDCGWDLGQTVARLEYEKLLETKNR